MNDSKLSRKPKPMGFHPLLMDHSPLGSHHPGRPLYVPGFDRDASPRNSTRNSMIEPTIPQQWQVDAVVEDVVERMEQNTNDLQSTTFYRVVLGGNVSFAKAVLDKLNSFEHRPELEWLIQTREKKLRTDYYEQKCGIRKVCMAFARVSLFIFLALMFFITTIFFYSIHLWLYNKRLEKRKRIYHHIKLPIAFAALSGKRDMILLFEDIGVDLDQRDPSLNNVFHYISDMSIDKPEKSLVAYKAMVDVMKDRSMLRELIYTKGHNAYGMTPFEHMILFGSPILLSEVSKTIGVVREPVLSISDKVVLMEDDSGDNNFIADNMNQNYQPLINEENEDDCDKEVRYNLDKFNVSIYESSDMFGKQSKVLNLMATRELILLTEKEMELLYKCAFLNRWWHFKVNQMKTFTSLMRWTDIVYTIIILLLLVSVGGDTRTTPLKTTMYKTRTLVFMDKITALPDNFTIDPNVKYSQEASEMLPDFSKAFVEFPGRKEMWEYAETHGMYLFELPEHFKNVPGYGNINATMVAAMYNLLCNGTTNGNDDLMHLDQCEEEAIERMIQTCDSLDRNIILNSISLKYGTYYKLFYFKVPLDIYEKATAILMFIIIGIAGMYLLFDLLERLIFLFRKVAHLDQPIRGIMLAIVSTSFPGSYTKRQLNVWSCSCFVAFFFYGMFKDIFNPDSSLKAVEHRINMNSYFIISGLIFRFLMHIHAMRLFRGIGHFVITTYLMGTNLIHFTTVYGAVLFVFSIIFHFLMRNPECPALKVEEFKDLMTSLYTTFQLGMGHGEVDIYTINTPCQVTYILYTIICVLLLMNLIIAIMSTTAMQIMSDPWKTATWEMEWLKEALAAETCFQIMIAPVRTCLAPILLKSVGFSVGKKKDKGNVYIEVFSCTDD